MNSFEDVNQEGLSQDSERSKSPSEAAATPAGADAPAPAVEASAPVVTLGDETPGEKTLGENKSNAAPAPQTRAPTLPSPAADVKGAAEPPAVRLNLIPFVTGAQADAPPQPRLRNSYWRATFEKRYQIGMIAAGLALAGVAVAASLSMKAQHDQLLVSQSNETEDLAETVKALKVRLSAIDTAKHEDILELRKSVAELKSGLAAAQGSSATLAQFAARADRIEHDVDARIEKLGERVDHDSAAHNADFTAKLEKLGERVDHDGVARSADFAARLEKLEKKGAAPVVAAATQPAIIPVPVPAPAPAALPKQPTVLPPVAANVSKETTGSIAPQTPLRGWAVREVRGNVAIVAGPYGFRQVAQGDTLPGAGHVERIERRAAGWTVVTDRGIINSAAYGGGAYRAYGYGGYDGGYGPPEDEF
jgi:hypothetical protein